MDDKEVGLYDKYMVYKHVDGELIPVTDPVFVLNPNTDPIARKALGVYAIYAEQAGYEILADGVFEWLAEYESNER